MLFGVLDGELDYRVTRVVALTGGLSYLDWGLIKGFGAHIGPPIFLTDDAFKGVYLLPRIGFSRDSVAFEGVKADATLFDIGSTVGYQWQFHDGFSVRLGAGAAYYAAAAKADGIGTSLYEGFRPMVDGALGYTF